MRAPTGRSSGRGRVVLAIATLVAVFSTLAVNALSNFFPPKGMNIGEIANTILGGVLITPANYAFAIWGVIYLALIAYSIYQFRPATQGSETLRQIDALLIVACAAQMIWVFLFTLRLFWLSVGAMVGILLALIGAYLQLSESRGHSSRNWRWFVQVPFSIYLGWISVATIVNVASALYSSGWNGWGLSDPVWTVVMLVIGAVVAAGIALRRADIAYVLVFVWAYSAIAIRQADSPAIWITAVILAIALLLLVGYAHLRHPPLLPDKR